MRTVLAAAISCATMAAAIAQDEPKSAEQAFGEIFCLVKDFPPGTGPAMIATPSLADEIQKALDRNDVIAKAHPDEKPPLGDGVPFQSFQDATPECEVGKIDGEGVGAVVEIRHIFPDTPSANYSDRLVLGQGWRPGFYGLDDVRYGADGDNGTLRKTLVDAFQ